MNFVIQNHRPLPSSRWMRPSGIGVLLYTAVVLIESPMAPAWCCPLARPAYRVLLYTLGIVAPRPTVAEVLLYICAIAAVTPRLRAARRGIAARVPPVSGNRWTSAA